MEEEVKRGHPAHTRHQSFMQRYLTDDNGDIYAKYDSEGKRWEILPNTQYQLNGYYYETNQYGAITHCGGTLRENPGSRKSLNAKVDGMVEFDERGHLIGDQFDGWNKEGNLVAQSYSLNHGDYKAVEDTLAELVHEGHDVQVSYDMAYEGDSKRPMAIEQRILIDGYDFEEFFTNEPDMKPAESGKEEEQTEPDMEPAAAEESKENEANMEPAEQERGAEAEVPGLDMKPAVAGQEKGAEENETNMEPAVTGQEKGVGAEEPDMKPAASESNEIKAAPSGETQSSGQEKAAGQEQGMSM